MGFLKWLDKRMANRNRRKNYVHAQINVSIAYDLAKNKISWYEQLPGNIEDYEKGDITKDQLKKILAKYGSHFGDNYATHIANLDASEKVGVFHNELDEMGKVNKDPQLGKRYKLSQDFLFAIKSNFEVMLKIVISMEAVLGQDNLKKLKLLIASYNSELKKYKAVAKLYLGKGLYGGYNVWKK